MKLLPILFLLPMLLPSIAAGAVLSNSALGAADALRIAANRLLTDGQPDDAVKAANLLDSASQIDARNATIANQNSATLAFDQQIESGLAPLISTIVLAGTLLFNIYTARVAERDKRHDDRQKADQARQDNERQRVQDQEAAFKDALNLMLASDKFSPAAAQLASFVDGPYRTRALAAGMSLMRATRSIDTFKDVFNVLMNPVTDENLSQVVDLLRGAHGAVEPLYNAAYDPTLNDIDLKKLTSDQAAEYLVQSAKRQFLCAPLSALLRQPRPHNATVLDLSNLGFFQCSLSGADLRNANIDHAVWRYISLDDCDLRGVVNFADSWIFDTAWWYAKYIDAEFLDLLVNRCGYEKSQVVYSPRGMSREDYDENVARLRLSVFATDKLI